MVRKLPSMKALVAFEAAARHESFTRAAGELFVTQGAVSHQVKALEIELGLKLFNRLPQQLALTSAGRDYFIVVREALDRIGVGTDNLLKRQNSGVLTVNTSPNFASKWLVHRLGRFTDAFPQIDLRLGAARHHVDFAYEDVDIAVRHGDGTKGDLHMTRLCKEELIPVCSPKLMRGENSLQNINNLAKHNLVHFENRQDWMKWLDAAQIDNVDLSQGPIFEQASMVIDAAVGGQGVALARTGLAAHDLISGQLVCPSPVTLKLNYAYWIVCPQATANLPKIELFRNWLLEEAAQDMRWLGEIGVL